MNLSLRERLGQINAEIDEKQKIAAAKWAAFENVRDKIRAGGGDADMKAAESVHLEYATASANVKELEHVRDGVFRQLAGNGSTSSGDVLSAFGVGGKSIGTRATDSFEYQQLQQSGVLSSERAKFDVRLAEVSQPELKALITGLSDTSGGAFIDADRKPYIAQPRRPPRILDLITTGSTDSDSVKYARQTTFTNVAAETAEATTTATGTKPEATIAFEIVEETVKTLAHWIPATRRSLADAGQMRTLIDSQLRYGLQLRLEGQVVNGDGAGENIDGILNTANILSQPKGSDSVPDAIHKAITQLRLGFIEPNGIAMHPNDWEVARLLRDEGGGTAGTGAYLLGPPSEAAPPTIWGLPVVVTAAIPDDTSIVADWTQAVLWLREGMQVLASDSHDDFFIKNLVAVLAEMRAAFGVLLPQAFAKVTGVDA